MSDKKEFSVPDPTPDDRMFAICQQITKQFGLVCQGELSTEMYDLIIRQIRFRQECHKQGFDNLVQLIEMARDDCAKFKELALQERGNPEFQKEPEVMPKESDDE